METLQSAKTFYIPQPMHIVSFYPLAWQWPRGLGSSVTDQDDVYDLFRIVALCVGSFCNGPRTRTWCQAI